MIDIVNDLVIVHVEMLDPSCEGIQKLIRDIHERALLTLQRNKRVFILSVLYPFDLGRNGSSLKDMCTTIPFQNVPESQRLPSGLSLGDAQFIALKFALIEAGIKEVDVTGVARSICVRNLDHMLRGVPLRDLHPEMSEFLSVEDARLRSVIRVVINSCILENLCLD